MLASHFGGTNAANAAAAAVPSSSSASKSAAASDASASPAAFARLLGDLAAAGQGTVDVDGQGVVAVWVAESALHPLRAFTRAKPFVLLVRRQQASGNSAVAPNTTGSSSVSTATQTKLTPNSTAVGLVGSHELQQVFVGDANADSVFGLFGVEAAVPDATIQKMTLAAFAGHAPLSYDDGRYFVAQYQRAQGHAALAPLFVMVDHSLYRFIGAVASAPIASENVNDTFETTTISVSCPKQPILAAVSAGGKQPTLTNGARAPASIKQLEEHFLLRHNLPGTVLVHTRASATYDIVGTTSEYFSAGGNAVLASSYSSTSAGAEDSAAAPNLDPSGIGSCLAVELSWEGVNDQVLCTPPRTANATLRLRAVPGTDDRSAGNRAFAEVQALRKLEAARSASSSSSSSSATADTTAESVLLGQQSIAPLTSAFLNFINDDAPESGLTDASNGLIAALQAQVSGVAVPLLGPSAAASASGPGASVLSLFSLPARLDFDFTERLWEFLRHASTTEDLAQAVTQILNVLLLGELQPMIHRTNPSSLATLIREALKLAPTAVASTAATVGDAKAARRQLADAMRQLQTPTGALDTLVEMGVCKLRRDFTHYLLSEELVSWSQLGFFSDSTVPLSEQVERVARLLAVVELFVVARTFTDLPHASLRQLLRAALDYYTNHSSSDHPLFVLAMPTFSAQTAHLKRPITSAKPSSWTLALYTTNFAAVDIVQCTLQPPFELPSDDIGARAVNSFDLNSVSYYECGATFERVLFTTPHL
ncbi:hypothetical protein CAOG_007213 [Capsaspora owczarzaki ATCC 30864]|uniref:Uncharacterized protein n=1 Tax=Capsaspora owczarzaki (strain ATCC 30864) TaxID=595528 RepID=A0A0D2X578_CAPO3|nr:hypothetical protein CAOG_007213 [Capsaspora owczarzaki ATCC 30864]